MVSTALSLSPEVTYMGQELIRLLTGFDEEEENFQICEDFFTSNMLYHSFLDPREKTVTEKLDKIAEKWTVQAKPRKSQRMVNLLRDFDQSPVFQSDQHEQHDIRIRLLSLLLHLSNADDSKVDYQGPLEVEPPPVEDESEASKKASRVRRLLREGEVEYRFPAEDSELSEWSEDDSTVISSPVQDPPLSPDKQPKKKLPEFLPGCSTPLSPPGKIPPSGTLISTDPNSSKSWLQARVLPQYWVKERDGKTHAFPVEVTFEACNLVKQHEEYCQKNGLPITEKMVLSEYQVLREIILTFFAPCNCNQLPLFNYDSNRKTFIANDGISIPSLLPEALRNFMLTISKPLTAKRRLDSFIDGVFYRSSNSSVTFKAYADALYSTLYRFSESLLSIEGKVRAREGTYTMLDFSMEMGPWFSILEKLGAFHKRAILSTVGIPDADYNWQSAIFLLARLNEAIDMEHQQQMHEIYVDLYLKSLEPYFRIMGSWVSLGRLQDHANEFVHAVNPKYHADQMRLKGEELHESFWSLGFTSRPFEDVLERYKLPIPGIFKRIFPRILHCGKSIEVLAIMQRQNRFSTDFKYHIGTEQMYKTFLDNLKQVAVPKEGIEDAVNNFEDSVVVASDDSDSDGDDCPYLKAAMDCVLEPKSTKMESQKHRPLLEDFKLDPIKPITDLLDGCIVPIVSDCVDFASSRLLHLFINTLDLERHLSMIRKTFLMEAGDLMAEFNKSVFVSLRDFDSLSLTMLLRDCFPTTEDLIERFHIELNQDEKVSLHYDVEWPLSIVIHTQSLKTYNSIFQFLLKIKHSVWALNQINAKTVATAVDNAEAFVCQLEADGETFMLGGKRSEATHDDDNPTKIHRILLLKCWLLHFVNSFHSYVMTRVMHSTELELKSALDTNKSKGDLDGIIDSHDHYVQVIMNRCFLNPKETVLKKSVLKVLDICLQLHGYYDRFCAEFETISGLQIDDKARKCDLLKGLNFSMVIEDQVLDKMESNYSHCHQFLATTLRSIIQNRNVPHLEGLAASFIQTLPKTYAL